MRYAIAIAVLALSGVALILGFGQWTFLAPPEAVTYSLEDSADQQFAVISAEEIDRVKGAASVTVTGADAFVATGSQRDIDAWLEVVDHAVLETHPQTKSITATKVKAQLPSSDDAEVDESGEVASENAEASEGTADAEASETDAESQTPAPQGSDLWIDEAAPIGETATLDAIALNAEQAVIVSTGDTSGLGKALTITWTQDQRTPWAGPLLVGGGVLALVGAVLLLLAIDHRHRGLGPRRGRKGPLQGIRGTIERKRHERSLKRLAAPALILSSMLVLSGCSASDWPDFTGAQAEPTETMLPASEIAPVPLTRTQIERIIGDVAEVADSADETLDAELLKQRFTSDAFTQREASYTIRKAVPDYALVPPHITIEELGYTLVQSTQGWPRTMFVALASDIDGEDGEATGDEGATPTQEPTDGAEAESAETDNAAPTEEDPASPSLGLILTQKNPFENYLVSRVIALRGGITMPEAAAAEDGTALLADDLQTLVLQPSQVASEFAAILQNGIEVPEAEHFTFTEDDPLITQSGISWVNRSQERASADGYSIQYSVSVKPGEEPITALSVSDGGALVAVTVVEDRVSDTAGSTTRVRAEGAVSALSGLSGQQTRLVNTVTHQMLFYVPSKVSGGQVQLLGATSEMVGASN